MPSATDIVSEAASLAANDLKEALKSHQSVTFVLAGGRLPPLANRILAEKYASSLDWRRILFLIGDERCVPLDDSESSWLGARAIFSLHPEIPEKNKLRPQSNLSAELAAERYTNTLLALPRVLSSSPILDHMWLGMGEDGHTLSLFPDHPSFTLAKETEALIIPVHGSPKAPSDRISFSLKTLEGVKTAVVFISGASKAPIMAQIAAGNHSLPIVVASQTIERAGGHVIWLVDEEASSKLPKGQSFNLG